MLFTLLIFFFLNLLSIIHSLTGPHITDVNILLPPLSTHPIEYRLQGTDGCFSWSYDHHDIISLQPEFNSTSNSCSTSAKLKSIATYNGRKETAIYATDLRSGSVIRCKVFVDEIIRVQIFHSSVKLDLDGLATLRVRGFDREENVFSSLVGLQFDWGLMPGEEGGRHRLVHVPLKESPLSDCGGFCGDLDTQIQLEDSGVFSDLFAVKGIEIGHEIVTVNLIEPKYQHMADKIVLTVAEAMSIEPPSPVFVIVGATVRYNLKVIRQNVAQAITLPSRHHRWSIVNSSVAQVDSLIGVAHALNLGITTVTAEDTRVEGHVQMSSLHVVIPDSLCLYKLPLTPYGDPAEGMSSTPSTARWYVIVGQQYAVHMKVFSGGSDGHEVYITESDDVKLEYNEYDHWETLLVPDILAAKHHWQSPRLLKAKSQGLGRLTASLAYRGARPETIEVLKIVQEVMVCDQVKIDMSHRKEFSKIVHLPWVAGIYQELSLKATGGCMETSIGYKWFSSDMSIVSISASGIVQAKKPGQVTIKVVSAYDALNYDQVDVKVSVPSQMVMLQNFPVETVVGTYLQAAVTLKASDGSYFSSCESFSSITKWNCGSGYFKIFNTTSEASTMIKLPQNDQGFNSLFGPPCAWTNIYTLSAGRSLLHASLSSSMDGSDFLKASSLIAAYNPLVVQQIGNGNHFGGYSLDLPSEEVSPEFKVLNELYLAPGTQLDVMLVGGPERWDHGVEFVETVNVLNKESLNNVITLVNHETIPKGRVYRVSCAALGNFQLVFSRGNLIGDDHPLPALEKVDVSLICTFPSSITLIANEPVNALNLIQSAFQADRSPERIHRNPITVANGCTIRVAAVGIHEHGKAFANSSSLSLKWELSGCNGLAYWEDSGLESSKASWERFLILQNTSGMCTVRATVVGSSDTTINSLYDRASKILDVTESILTDAIHLQLVSSLRILPDFLLIYFNADAKVSLSITGGTCSLEATVNDTRVLDLVQPPTSLECTHLTVSPKGFGTSQVTVNDIGLAPPLAASAVVEVADVDWIKIISQEQISLMDGSEKALNLVAGVRDGSVFGSYQLAYMDVHIHIEDSILELVGMHISMSGVRDTNVPSFVIRAKRLGVTTLFVSAKQQSGHEIFSRPISVEVYAPPRIHPDDIFLVPGASYVLTLEGGPTIGGFIEYASMDDSTVNVHKSSGRLSAVSAGNTTVRAIVYGSEDTVICEAEARVRVGIPISMILSAQSEQLSVGREMPVFPSLAEGNLFSFYELCKNFLWTIDDEKVLRFHGDEKDNEFINMVFGRSAGKTKVAVSFTCDFTTLGSSQIRSYNASTSLWVVPEPPFALGVPITWILPPFYTTSNLLPESSESYNQWDSYNRKGTIVYSLLRTCAGKNEEMQLDPISLDGGRIRTFESNNLGCIQAKDWTTGRTEIACCVKVAEVSQIRVSSKGSSLHVLDFAVGAEHELAIQYYDSLGNPFHEAYNAVEFDADTNYPDVVSVNKTHGQNGHILLKALRHGRALVRVSIKNYPHKSDYIMISVGAHLYPHNPVIDLGSHFNFSIEGLDGPVHGRWLSSNESVLSVDMVSGRAHAIGEGATQVIFQGSDLRLQTTATIQRVDLVSVDSPIEMLTNVPFPTKGYYFSIKFSESRHKIEGGGNNNGILFDCVIDPPYVGYVKPWMELDTGNSYCLFFPYSPEYLASTIPKSKASKTDVSVSITASLRDSEHITGSATALFVGGFSILNKDPMPFNLKPKLNKTIITIVGNTDVEVHWKNRDQMLVSPISRNDFGLGGQAEYEVKALGGRMFTDKIVFVLPATGQRVELDVKYEPTKTVQSPSSKALWLGFISIITLLISSWAMLRFYTETQPVIIEPVPGTPSVAGPVTPDRGGGTPGGNLDQSPRTPQPFIEYVRRTIDETPYYKRDGRRRVVNPQNTY
ncbi:hypothetical protein ACHQM5_011091 [Ranunculus cassubicifolius]